jgi:hypothetical protein
MKSNAYSRREPATKPPFSRKRNRKGEGAAMPNAFSRSLSSDAAIQSGKETDVCRNYHRLSALPTPTTGIRSTDYPLCSGWRYTTPEYPMCSTLPERYCNRLSAVICLSILQPTIRSALSGNTLQPTIQSTDCTL